MSFCGNDILAMHIGMIKSMHLNYWEVRISLRRFTFVTSTIILAVLFVTGAYFFNDKSGPVQEKEDRVEKYNRVIFNDVQKKSEPLDVLLLGLDEEGVRTDVVILINYAPESAEMNILSLERDTLVVFEGRKMKLNAVYAAGGVTGIIDEVYNISGLEADYHVIFDFKGFRKVVDTLGGVMFNVPFRMKYDDPVQDLHINLKKGMQLLDGKKAEQLVRYRKGNKKGSGYTDGDVGRIRMQQDFIKAIIEQKANLKYISKANEIFGVLQKHLKTDIGLDFISRYIGSLAKLEMDKVEGYSLPGESIMINDGWYYIHDIEKTETMINNNFFK